MAPGNHHDHSEHSGEHGHEAHDAATMMTREFWDDRYASADAIWSGSVNVRLVEQVSELTPGTALDVGSGEGADAIWLATQGWQVTGLDISTVALARAAQHAAAVGAEVTDRITWQQADLLSWSPPEESYDLVSAQFMHLPPDALREVHRGLAAAVRPGGILLVVGHDFSDLSTTMKRPAIPELFYTAEDVAAALDPGEWEVLVASSPERQATDPDGQSITIRDAVMKARRRL